MSLGPSSFKSPAPVLPSQCCRGRSRLCSTRPSSPATKTCRWEPRLTALAVLLHGRQVQRDRFPGAPLGTWEAQPINLPCQCRLLRIGSKVRTFTRQPANRSKSSGRVNFRSRPGELASSVYSAPGTRSSTSSKTPKSRLKAAQSSCVTPESCSTASLPSRRPFGPSSSWRQPAWPSVARGPRRFFRDKRVECVPWPGQRTRCPQRRAHARRPPVAPPTGFRPT